MCLGIPGEVVAIDLAENWALIEILGVKKKVDVSLVDEEIRLGDFLVVHAGYAIGKVNLVEAEERLKLWEEILAC